MARTAGTLVHLQGGHSTFLKGVGVNLALARLASAKDERELAHFDQERPAFIDPDSVVLLISFP